MAFTEKPLFVPPPIEVSGYHVKRYHVTADPAGIAPEVEKAAYAERDAWVRHVLAPDRPDLAAYLADTLPEGTTGDRR